ncbi:hypothetical protein QJS10_CPA16g01100 [Acorus calamus]|uniref:Uncharacterized protein n=1 Tax=Acorus calamus TaxID=4465 RepID=A0AAV9D3R1_ACOCL|nr:hypothetical protein QJS10_CPA16g01100 [Acorus calamus]
MSAATTPAETPTATPSVPSNPNPTSPSVPSTPSAPTGTEVPYTSLAIERGIYLLTLGENNDLFSLHYNSDLK